MVDDADQHCKIDYRLEHGLCCKESDNPSLDRLLQYIALTSVAEKLQRTQGRCSTADAINSLQSLYHFITQQGVVELQGNLQLEAEVNELRTAVQQLTIEQIQQQQLLARLQAEIDTNLQRYHLPKDELARPSDSLNKLFTHLRERHLHELGKSQVLMKKADDKLKDQMDVMEQNIDLRLERIAKLRKQYALMQETTLKRQVVNQLLTQLANHRPN